MKFSIVRPPADRLIQWLVASGKCPRPPLRQRVRTLKLHAKPTEKSPMMVERKKRSAREVDFDYDGCADLCLPIGSFCKHTTKVQGKEPQQCM